VQESNRAAIDVVARNLLANLETDMLSIIPLLCLIEATVDSFLKWQYQLASERT